MTGTPNCSCSESVHHSTLQLTTIEHDLIRNVNHKSKAVFRAAVAAYTAYHIWGRAPAAWVPAPLLRQLAKAYGI